MIEERVDLIREIAYGRVGLLGNPSDIYGGKCISFTFSNYAEVSLKDSLEKKINGLIMQNHGQNNSSHELIHATVDYLKENLDESIEQEPMEINYKTRIPIGSGLAGSSAIIIALIKSLNKKFKYNLKLEEIAELALHTEVDKMKITCGFQDRYIISFGGVLYMDFEGKEYQRKEDDFGKIMDLNINHIPFFIALSVQPKRSSTVHNPLREEFLNGPYNRRREIKYKMDKIAELAVEGVEPLLNRDWYALGELMNKNTELRQELSPHLTADLEIINYSLKHGAFGAKVAGSGGAVVVLSDEDNINSIFNQMSVTYPCFKPSIARY